MKPIDATVMTTTHQMWDNAREFLKKLMRGLLHQINDSIAHLVSRALVCLNVISRPVDFPSISSLVGVAPNLSQ